MEVRVHEVVHQHHLKERADAPLRQLPPHPPPAVRAGGGGGPGCTQRQVSGINQAPYNQLQSLRHIPGNQVVLL